MTLNWWQALTLKQCRNFAGSSYVDLLDEFGQSSRSTHHATDRSLPGCRISEPASLAASPMDASQRPLVGQKPQVWISSKRVFNFPCARMKIGSGSGCRVASKSTPLVLKSKL